MQLECKLKAEVILMPISYNEKLKLFTITTSKSSYAFMIEPYGLVTHLYFGEALSKNADLTYLTNTTGVGRAGIYPDVTYEEYEGGAGKYCPYARLMEYSSFGIGDWRQSALAGRFSDGSQTIDLRYHSHEIVKGKRALNGLPSVYLNKGDKAQSLILTLKDKAQDLFVELNYSIIEGHGEIMRSAKIINKTGKDFYIDSALSMTLDIAKKEFDIITFYGKPNNERYLDRAPLRHGKTSCESTAGLTTHFTNNSVILCDHSATEDSGECIGATLVYSGNFLACAELDHADRVRMSLGINPTGFCWKLENGESFETPEVILSYTKDGLGDLSRGYHDLIRYNVCRGKYKDERRPVLINNWEATVFEFNEDKLVEIARDAKEFGVEMLVMDDGWFGHRNWDNNSLGDWVEFREKLPNGIPGLCKRINELGMKLGVWFEPEMISEDSELYKKHPDWCIHVPGRAPFRGRWELVLDLTREEIRDCIYNQMAKILSESPVAYIKWDANRYITDAYSLALKEDRQGEFFHRYILGVYDLMEGINKNFPDVLFENCASGGGRYDAGMMYYSPQIWCSDNTCPSHRMKIQYGSSFIYPISTMGSHIAYAPNINTFHNVSVLQRGITAMAGTFGFELDPMHESEQSKKEMLIMTDLYKKHYFTINHGDYFRLISPYEQKTATTRISSWQFVSKDKKTALFNMVQLDNVNDGADLTIKLKGLDEKKTYALTMYYDERGEEKPFPLHLEKKALGTFSGEILMKAGLHLSLMRGDNMSTLIELEETK